MMVAQTEIPTAAGVVRGSRGARVLRWRAIPYAAPPVGELRFRAPQPVEPWSGVRAATEFGFAAMQHRTGARTGLRTFQPTGEDALTLNVTVPVSASETPRPVLVFIHGGGYLFGTSATYPSGRLATRGDVVVVTLNYRLGAFGYADFSEFSTGTRIFETNLGLRDQVAALAWVRDNIAVFGGDPGNVTVFGESAGAHAVLSLFATPAAAGLFRRGIAQSPPADWAVSTTDAKAFARRCLSELGIRPDEAAEALLAAAPNDIRRAADRLAARVRRERPGVYLIAPEVDGDFLPKAPIDALVDGTAHRLPLIIGTNRDEGTLFARNPGELPTRPEELRAAIGAESESRVAAAYSGYPGRRGAIRAGGDFTFWRPSVTIMAGHSRYAPTYAYRYDFTPRALRLTGFGATHASELIPVFGLTDTAIGRAVTAAGGGRGLREVTRQIQDNWLEFARTGAPLPAWPAYTEDRRTTLIIDAPTRLVDDPDRAKRLAWEGVCAPTLAATRS